MKETTTQIDDLTDRAARLGARLFLSRVSEAQPGDSFYSSRSLKRQLSKERRRRNLPTHAHMEVADLCAQYGS